MKKKIATSVFVPLFVVGMDLSCKPRSFNASKTLGAVSAPAKPGTTGASFDVNDVSILFPSVSAKQDLAKMVAAKSVMGSTAAAADDLFSSVLASAEDSFNFKKGFAPGYTKITNLDDWKIVAVRIDPCFKKRIETSECQAQIRLVAQAIGHNESFDDVEIMPFDSSMHLVYLLPNNAALEAAVADFADLKFKAQVPTNGIPLHVHPGFSGPNAGAFENAVAQIIQKYALPSSLRGIAFMGSSNAESNAEGGGWAFSIGTVTAGRYTPETSLPLTGKPVVSFDASDRRHGSSPFSPEPVAGRGEVTLAKMLTPLSPDSPKMSFENSVRIENPRQTAQGNSDCVSCHLAQESQNSRHFKDLSTGAFLVSTSDVQSILTKVAYKAPPVTTAVRRVDMPRIGYLFRNFGLVDGGVNVSLRTIQESAEVAEYLNANVLKLSTRNDARQGKSCNEEKLKQCLAFNGGLPCYEKPDICK